MNTYFWLGLVIYFLGFYVTAIVVNKVVTIKVDKRNKILSVLFWPVIWFIVIGALVLEPIVTLFKD